MIFIVFIQVDAATNREQIVCYCNHLTSFGSNLLVVPNPIDFDSVFQNFGSGPENVAVLTLISTILGVYIIGVIWARRADKRDSLFVRIWDCTWYLLCTHFCFIIIKNVPYNILRLHLTLLHFVVWHGRSYFIPDIKPIFHLANLFARTHKKVGTVATCSRRIFSPASFNQSRCRILVFASRRASKVAKWKIIRLDWTALCV